MKRVFLCACILFLMVGLSIWLLITIQNRGKEITQSIETAIEFYEDGDFKKSKEQINLVAKQWAEYYRLLSLVMPNENIQEITQSISKLNPLLENCTEEFIAECNSVKYSILLLFENEFPSLSAII